MRIRRKDQNMLILIAGILVLALLTGLVMNLYGVFDAKEQNSKNLISMDNNEKTYAAVKTHNSGYGVKYTVDEYGAVKAKGTATAEHTFVILSGLKLEANKEYTLSCGVDSVTYNSYALRLHNKQASKGSANEYIYAELDGTFTAPNSTDSYDVEIIVKEDAKVNVTFRPVLVEGKTAGDFFEK